MQGICLAFCLALVSLFIRIHKDTNAKEIQCCCKKFKCAREEILGKFLCFSMPAEKLGHDENIFKASALWADAFYKSKCPSVRVCVCSLLRYCLNLFLPPLPEVGCPNILQIRNPWGKVMERYGLRFEHFCLEVI